MILTTNITAATETSTVVPKRESFPKTVTGPATNTAADEAVYKLTDYTYKYNKTIISNPTIEAQTEFDNDKENIKWVFWVDGGLMDDKKDYIIIENRALINEATEDFTEETDKTKFIENIKSKAYLQATSEIVTEGGNIINKLTIKFSKWLDGKNVYVEAYRNTPEHNANTNYVKITTISAQPEIIDAYWLNAQGKKITSVGYSSAVNLGIKTLGLVGENLTISLYDYDLGVTPDDLLQWNGGANSHVVTITGRHTLVPYNVEEEGAAAYANAFLYGDELDNTIEVFVKIESTNTALQATLEDQYARIDFTPEETATVYLASKEKVTINGSEVDQYNILNQVYPGSKAYLVVETTNLNGTVSFSVTESTPLLVAANTKLPLIKGSTEQIDFTATIIDNFAAVEVQFQEIDTTKYTQWVDLLVTPAGVINESTINLKATIATTGYNSAETFKVKAPIVTQKIYPDGKISKEDYVQELIRKVKLEYHNNDSVSPYNFGIFDVIWAQKWIRGSYSGGAGWKKVINGGKTRYYKYDGTPGVNKVPLVSIFDTSLPTSDHKVFDYQNGGTSFLRISDNSSREYFNPERLASILGAVKQTGFDDVTLMGSVDTDGTGAYSVTHVNGNNIDLRYLRTDNKRPLIDPVSATNPAKVPRILISDSLFDEIRMNTLIDALYDFGFARLKKNYSYKFGVDKRLLNHSTHLAHHHHHLHIQGFKANYK